MTVKQSKRRPSTDVDAKHTISIEIGEFKPHRMFLRQHLASGTTADGREIEVAQTTSSIIIHVGKFGDENGRQFLINIVDLVAATLEGVGIK